MDDDLGPLLIAPPSYLEVRRRIRDALGFPNEWRPLLIGIDGVDGSGKSSLAGWLSWQLEMPAIHLDIYIVRGRKPLAWRLDDLNRAIESRLDLGRPVIVEGILLKRALDGIQRVPDFCIFVEKSQHRTNMTEHLDSYIRDCRPKDQADFLLQWSSADHDACVLRAHNERRDSS